MNVLCWRFGFRMDWASYFERSGFGSYENILRHLPCLGASVLSPGCSLQSAFLSSGGGTTQAVPTAHFGDVSLDISEHLFRGTPPETGTVQKSGFQTSFGSHFCILFFGDTAHNNTWRPPGWCHWCGRCKDQQPYIDVVDMFLSLKHHLIRFELSPYRSRNSFRVLRTQIPNTPVLLQCNQA